MCAAEQLPYAHVSSFHVVVVPGVPLVSGAVHDSGQLFWSAVTINHMQTAKQENCVQVQSREQLLKVPCQHPFVHYHTMQWESMGNILKMKTGALFLGPVKPLTSCRVLSRSLFLQHQFLVETGQLWRICWQTSCYQLNVEISLEGDGILRKSSVYS